MTIEMTVLGTPAPKGSPRVVTHGRGGAPLPKPRVLKDGPKTVFWHALVADEAQRAMESQKPFIEVSLSVEITFYLRRPKSHYGKRGLLPSARPYPAVKPDVDKLVRATLDPLQGVVFDDDSRIVSLTAVKRYAELGKSECATIVVREHPSP